MDVSSGEKNNSPWAPLLFPVFRIIWLAAVFSNIGTWMQDVGESWLMTTLTNKPLLIALIQSTDALPIFLLALPAGALADILDRRIYLLFLQISMCVVVTAMAIITYYHLMTPGLLLSMSLLVGIFIAFTGPAWLAVAPEMVPKNLLSSAVTLNGVGINIARLVGPAMAGIVIAISGSAAVFAINGLSFLTIIIALLKWRRAPITRILPAERFFSAMRVGFRYGLNAPLLRNVLMRTFGFFIFASSIMALLPLFVRKELLMGPQSYGLLVGLFGLGATFGVLLLPMLRKKFNYDQLIFLSEIVFSFTVVAITLGKFFPLICIAMIIGGVAWLVILSALNTAVILVTAAWIRARASSLFLATMFGGIAAGSAIWGYIASVFSVSDALIISAIGLIISAIATRSFSLQKIVDLDLTHSLHIPDAPVIDESRYEHGPVMVIVEYIIDTEKLDAFKNTMQLMRQIRLREGAFFWELFVDSNNSKHVKEIFMIESWLEHLRQHHERATVYDKQIHDKIIDFHGGENPPKVSHLIASK